MKSTVIVPCAGRSNFLDRLPKFLSLNHAGIPMVVEAISRLNLKNCHLVISVLREHEMRYKIRENSKKFFGKLRPAICVLPSSLGSQAGDVYQTIKLIGIDGPFLSKDSDNIFRLDKVNEKFNYVAVESLENLEMVNARDKSYVSTDTSGLITAIEEKQIISNTFSMGGYYFLDPREFCSTYEILKRRYGKSGPELYMSRIISFLVLERKAKFKVKPVSECVDFGTVSEWLFYKSKYKTYFVNLEGILVKTGKDYLNPLSNRAVVFKENIEAIRNLHAAGNQVIIVTSRKEIHKKVTEKELRKLGIPYHELIMGIYDSQQVVINGFSITNPYPSVRAINIPFDSQDLSQYLKN